MADSITSPTDVDTSEKEEYTRIMSTYNATVFEKYMFIFFHYLNFKEYNILIIHNPNVTILILYFIGGCNGDFLNSHPDSTIQTPN